MHPVETFIYVFVVTLILLCLVAALGYSVKRMKWGKIRKAGTGSTITVDMVQGTEKK